jgi:integrase
MKDQNKQPIVTLMIRAKINEKWSRFKAVYGRTGRVIPGLVIYDGQELKCSEVSYELRFYKDGKPRYRPAGKNATDAEEQRRTLATRLRIEILAKSAGVGIELESDRKSIRQWASTYMEKQSVLLGSDQLQRIKYVIALFFEACRKTHIDELSESDLLHFLRHLSTLPVYRNLRAKVSKRRNAAQRRNRCPVKQATISARTIFSYYLSARKWLLKGGADPKIFPPPPKYEEPEVTVYSPEQIKSLFALVTGDLRIALGLMLKCGLRRNEAAFAYFSDINFVEKTILVRGKPEWKFKVKNRIQRYIPITDDLLSELRQWEADNPGRQLVITTDKGQPELRLIRSLKRFVYLHGLRCGRCNHCRSGNPECEEWELHKFRRTYITGILRHVDLRTAQEYAGHTRITSTERYLRPASAPEGQRRVSSIDWTVSFYT